MDKICQKYNTKPLSPPSDSIIGIAVTTIGQEPINGLRHIAENGSNGWYIWCGTEYSEAPDFFSPICIEHIGNHLPIIKKYLNLPSGFRFLIDSKGHEDVWFDENLIKT